MKKISLIILIILVTINFTGCSLFKKSENFNKEEINKSNIDKSNDTLVNSEEENDINNVKGDVLTKKTNDEEDISKKIEVEKKEDTIDSTDDKKVNEDKPKNKKNDVNKTSVKETEKKANNENDKEVKKDNDLVNVEQDADISDENTDKDEIENIETNISEKVEDKNSEKDMVVKNIDDKEINSDNNENETNKDNSISESKIKDIENNISLKDKAIAMKLILSKLKPSDIKLLKKLASDGLTDEERKEAIKIALERYTAEEIEIIRELYHKYMD